LPDDDLTLPRLEPPSRHHVDVAHAERLVVDAPGDHVIDALADGARNVHDNVDLGADEGPTVGPRRDARVRGDEPGVLARHAALHLAARAAPQHAGLAGVTRLHGTR